MTITAFVTKTAAVIRPDAPPRLVAANASAGVGLLADALRFELGIFGGTCSRGEIDICYQGAGLKIWGSRETVNHVTDKPVFEGASTVAMAREVYGISNPDERQLALL